MLAPDFREVPQILLGFFQRDSGIDFFQVGDYAFEILVADIFRGTADLMDDAALQPALGIHCLDCLHHTAQAVGAEQINV